MTLDYTEVTSNTRAVAADAVIGFQYSTPSTDWGIDESEHTYSIKYTRWCCDCGQVDPRNRDEILEYVDVRTTVTSLLSRLEELSEEGTIGGSYTESNFFETFEAEERNWAEAIGSCLYEGA